MTSRALLGVFVMLALVAVVPVRAEEESDSPSMRSSRRQRLTRGQEEERDRLLDQATQYRALASSLRDRADEFFQKNKNDMGQELADKADAIEERARGLEDEADEIEHPPASKLQGRHVPKRPSFRDSEDRRRK